MWTEICNPHIKTGVNVEHTQYLIINEILGLIYETNVRQKSERTLVSTQNLEFINMDVSSGYDQISHLGPHL